MKATQLQKIWIGLYSVCVTLRISVMVLYQRATNTFDREWAEVHMLRWWAGRLLDSVRVRYTVHNPNTVRPRPGHPTIIMSNHCSHYDIPLILMSLPGSIRMLAKKELFRIPVWGRGMEAGEFVAIDRNDHDQALKDLEHARELMESGIVLWIAPEGTRSRDGRLGPFKKGCFRLALDLGATIIPVGIRGSAAILPADTWDFAYDQRVSVHVGEPVEASAYSLETRDALMEEVRSRILVLSGEPESVRKERKAG